MLCTRASMASRAFEAVGMRAACRRQLLYIGYASQWSVRVSLRSREFWPPCSQTLAMILLSGPSCLPGFSCGQDFYDLLEVARDADAEQIKTAVTACDWHMALMPLLQW